MSVALAERAVAPRRRRCGASDVLVEARGLRWALRAAVRAGRTPTTIARPTGVQTAGVQLLLDGRASFASEALYLRLRPLLPATEVRFVIGVRPGHVPGSVLLEIIEQAIRRDDLETAAARCGVATRRLMSIRDGETRSVHFATADRIVTRLDGPGRWRSDPELRRWYWASTAST